jgi:uncharacterized protein YndB with AHSA1/START domain
MSTITREYLVERPLEEVWKKLSDVGAVNELIDYLGEVELDGQWRSCSTVDGGELRELIVTVDDEEHRLVYSVRTSPFGLEHHSASWQLFPEVDGTRFRWVTDFTPDEVRPVVEPAIDATAASILRALA